jgi:hypothetical protein
MPQLTVTFCHHVNRFFDYLLGPKDNFPHREVTADEAKEAAIYIVEQASKSLGAGWNKRDIERLWPHLVLPGLPRQVRYKTHPDNHGVSGRELWTDGERSLVDCGNTVGLRLYASKELEEITDDRE